MAICGLLCPPPLSWPMGLGVMGLEDSQHELLLHPEKLFLNLANIRNTFVVCCFVFVSFFPPFLSFSFFLLFVFCVFHLFVCLIFLWPGDCPVFAKERSTWSAHSPMVRAGASSRTTSTTPSASSVTPITSTTRTGDGKGRKTPKQLRTSPRHPWGVA